MDRAIELVKVTPKIFICELKSMPVLLLVVSHPAMASALDLWRLICAPDAFLNVCILSIIIGSSLGDDTSRVTSSAYATTAVRRPFFPIWNLVFH